MGHIVGFALIAFCVGAATGGGIGAWIGFSLGKEHEARRYRKPEDWKREDKTTYQ